MNPVEPTAMVIGDTLNWVRDYNTVSYVDKDGNQVTCPASNHSLTYYLACPNHSTIITALATSNDYEVLVHSTTTEKWIAGNYFWAAYVTHSTLGFTKKWEIDRGELNVKESLSAAVRGYDGRSHVKKVLDALEAAIEGRADKATLDWVSYAIAGRSRTIDISELRIWYAQYRFLYKKEQAESRIDNNLETQERILIQFK